MKKKVLTKAATLAVALLMVSSLSACKGVGDSGGENGKITMMATTILTPENGLEIFQDKYEELTGIALDIQKPEHNQYYEKVSITFAAGEPCDIIELGSTYYPSYAAEGVLRDLSEYWESSDLKKSGIVNEKYVDNLRVINFDDGVKGLYGFPNQRGGGTVTYVRKDWMDALGISEPTSYEEFYDMLKAFKNIKSVDGYKEKYGSDPIYPITAAGLISTESPYEIYLREFYQDARPDFHYDEEKGEFIDGVLEPEMKAALERMRQAYVDGLIDPGAVTNKTSTCRDKFYNGTVGAFNYWAGQWAKTLDNNLKIGNPEAVLEALPSFDLEKEYYIERPSTAYVTSVFTSEEQTAFLFKNFIEYSHDGGEGQMLFTHGVEGVHYEYTNDDKTEAEQLPCLSDPSTLFEKSFYEAALSITEFDDPIAIDERITDSLDVFDADSKIYDVPTITTVVAVQLPDVEVAKRQLVANVVVEGKNVDEAIEEYKAATESQRTAILEDLNKISIED